MKIFFLCNILNFLRIVISTPMYEITSNEIENTSLIRKHQKLRIFLNYAALKEFIIKNQEKEIKNLVKENNNKDIEFGGIKLNNSNNLENYLNYMVLIKLLFQKSNNYEEFEKNIIKTNFSIGFAQNLNSLIKFMKKTSNQTLEDYKNFFHLSNFIKKIKESDYQEYLKSDKVYQFEDFINMLGLEKDLLLIFKSSKREEYIQIIKSSEVAKIPKSSTLSKSKFLNWKEKYNWKRRSTSRRIFKIKANSSNMKREEKRKLADIHKNKRDEIKALRITKIKQQDSDVFKVFMTCFILHLVTLCYFYAIKIIKKHQRLEVERKAMVKERYPI